VYANIQIFYITVGCQQKNCESRHTTHVNGIHIHPDILDQELAHFGFLARGGEVQRPNAVIFDGFHRLREAAATTIELNRHPCTHVRTDRSAPQKPKLKKSGPEGREVGEGQNRTLEEGEVARGRRAEEPHLRRPVSCRERRIRYG
jgi:hypothetical protein